jgi:hypothetical protein
MSLEHFDVRRIRDGATYNTKLSELLAYAEGVGDGASSGRWRGGLYRAMNGSLFAVREDVRRYFDQIGGNWTDNTSISLDVLDYEGSLKWCEMHDANLLVDFIEEVSVNTIVESVEEALAAPVEDSAVAEAEAEEETEVSVAVVLSIPDDQKQTIALQAEKAGLTVDAYFLQCVEARLTAQESVVTQILAEEEASAQEDAPVQEAAPVLEAVMEAPEPFIEAVAEIQIECVETECAASDCVESECIVCACGESQEELESASTDLFADNALLAVEEAPEDHLSPIEVLPVASEIEETVIFSIEEAPECESGDHEVHEAEIVSLTHYSGQSQNGLSASLGSVLRGEIGQAAE